MSSFNKFYVSYEKTQPPSFINQNDDGIVRFSESDIEEIEASNDSLNITETPFISNNEKLFKDSDFNSQKDSKDNKLNTDKLKISNKAKKVVSNMNGEKGSYSNKNKWVSDLKSAYRKAGINNENAITMLVAQDALESGWGKSVQGRFNYGNITPGQSWNGEIVNGKDKDSKGNPISQKFRSYNSIEEYAADKVQFLKRLYDFNENDDINTFTRKLQGGNRDKRRYAESLSYVNSVIKVYNSIV